MTEIVNSRLTQDIISKADEIRKETESQYLIVDYILLAALDYVDDSTAAQYGEEGIKLQQTLREYSDLKDIVRKNIMLSASEKGNSMTGSLLFQKSMYSARNKSKKNNRQQLTADVLLECILNDNRESLTKLLSVPQEGINGSGFKAMLSEGIEHYCARSHLNDDNTVTDNQNPNVVSRLVANTKRLQAALNEKILGQAHAVASFVSGYFQSALFAITDKERVRPKATFLFAGPPGVGKTFLAEEAAKAIGLPFRRFDMSEYSNSYNSDQLTGSDKTFKNSSEGLLTGFVAKNPECVILFDEIEKAHQSAIYLFLQVLDAGKLRDNRTDVEVSFKDTILIFTTNAGQNLYEEDLSDNLSSISRKVILSALRKDINPTTGEPYFPAAICSRFASGNVIMFNHLSAHHLSSIIYRRLDKHARELQEEMHIGAVVDERIPSILLMAEGALADARTVKSRADAFWGEELYELFRLASSEHAHTDLGNIKKVRFDVDLTGAKVEIVDLLASENIPEAIAFSDLKESLEQSSGGICLFHYAEDLNEAKKIYRERNIQFIVCSTSTTSNMNCLNREDVDSPSRRFLLGILSHFKALPVFILEDMKEPLYEEEKISYIRRGIQDFLKRDDNNPEILIHCLKDVASRTRQQQCLNELARANKVITFETSQTMTGDRTEAKIALFDFRLEVAVDAEDSQNILSAVSRPETKFDQVIGANEAKKELSYFVSYLQNPKRFMGYGVDAPKGVLLYGPPGTGKTMLAKAMAGESGVTFIAAEGNQFLQKYVGEGEAAIHKIFSLARKYAPSILFIDEIDAIAKARTGGEHTAAPESILTALLSEMDGFTKDTQRPVFVLAATNFNVEPGSTKSLDPALMRRFDRRIFVDLPDKNGRMVFLENQTTGNRAFKVSAQGIKSLVERSTGMSLAQLASVMELAKRELVREGRPFIDDVALEEAFENFSSGERRKWDDEQTLRTARHEAGHAFLNWYNGEIPSYITIVSRGSYGGYMQHADPEGKLFYTHQDLLNRICTALGGRAAEIVYYGPEQGLSSGASGDLNQATAIARKILSVYGMEERFGMATFDLEQLRHSELESLLMMEINRILKEQMERAIALLDKNKQSIDALVNRLLLVDHLNGDEINSIFSMNTVRD